MVNVPLSVLDLVPISSGSSPGGALRNTLDLARHAEDFGYARYWFAEHHLNPGVAGTSPPVMIALTASVTSHIRLGSGGVQFGHRMPLSTVEEFGLIEALYPGRIDLGIGRSGGRPASEVRAPSANKAPSEEPIGAAPVPAAARRAAEPGNTGALAAKGATGESPTGERIRIANGLAPNGLRVPQRFSHEALARSPRFELQQTLLQQPGAQTPDYGEQIEQLLALLRGHYGPESGPVHVVPGERAGVQVWILGSSGGQSAAVAGRHGLRFAANYHVSPGSVLDAVDGYRAAFNPSRELAQPYISVSADVVVARTEERARELASGYALWVRSIRSGAGAIEFPTPAQAGTHVWAPEDRALVQDRVETEFVGPPTLVADKLEQLQEATGASELIVTTITHGHADRVRSYELLAEEWRRR